MNDGIRLVAMSEEQVKRLRPIAESYAAPNSDLAGALVEAWEHGITKEEAQISADWILGHRPRSHDQLRWGVHLDHATRKLRSAFEETS